jgi:hypothetical protein
MQEDVVRRRLPKNERKETIIEISHPPLIYYSQPTEAPRIPKQERRYHKWVVSWSPDAWDCIPGDSHSTTAWLT